MSYEKNIPVKTKCPCGEGFIIQESKSNDWLQVKDLKDALSLIYRSTHGA